MKKTVLLAACFMFICGIAAADAVKDWGDFENELRKGNLTSAEAKFKAEKLVPQLSEETESYNIEEAQEWLFPVDGFTKSSLGNLKKITSAMTSSFREPKFLEGVEFLAQPYIRLFVSVKEKDLEPVDIVAANNGIVVYVKKGAMNSLGGNTVWVYNPAQNFFIYYGMLRNVSVGVGDIITRGDKIGSVRPSKKGYDLNFAVIMYGDETFSLFNYLDEME